MADDVHTQIANPKDMQKSILDTALETAQSIKTLDSLDKIQQQKAQLKQELATALKGLQTQLTVLKKGIPPLPKEFLDKQARAGSVRAKPKQVEIPENLETDIEEIKKRLSNL